jgi:hypothetical protein
MPLGSVVLMGSALRRSAEQGHPGGAIHHAGWLLKQDHNEIVNYTNFARGLIFDG